VADDKLQGIVQRMIDGGESEDNIAAVIHAYRTQVPQVTAPDAGISTDTVAPGAVLRAVGSTPTLVQGAARIAADNPRLTQKIIRGTTKAAAGGLGGLIAGEPGAVVGALAADLTPTQAGIRTAAGRLAGETPAVAQAAGRAQAVINYAEPLGHKLAPTDLIASTESPALDAYAKSMGQKVLRLYGPNGEQVLGPGIAAAAERAVPSTLRTAVSGAVRVLPAVGVAGDLLMAAPAYTAALQASPGSQIRNVMAGQYGLPQSEANTIPGPSMASVTSDFAARLRQAILDRLKGVTR
jgi:hypothetical protein